MQKNKTKIALMLKNHLSDYDYIRFDLDYLTSKYEVIFLDLQKILLSKISIKENTSKIKFVNITNFYQLVLILRRIKTTKVISFIDHPKNFTEYFIYVILKLYQFEISFIDVAPKLGSNVKTKNKIFFYLKNFDKFFIVLKKYVFHKFYNKFSFKYKNVLVGGKIDKHGRHKYFENIVETHTIDYVLYKKIRQNYTQRHSPDNYAVFLDDDLPEHPDYEINKQEPPIKNIEKYYRNLKAFFHQIESQFNLKIIIASHPKRKNFSYFKNFQIEKFKTPQLIIDSKMTFVHASNSLSFSVLSNKPVIFLTNDEANISWIGLRICNLAKFLNAKLFNIDDDNIILDEKLNLICTKSYLKYKNQYLNCKKDFTGSIWSNIDF